MDKDTELKYVGQEIDALMAKLSRVGVDTASVYLTLFAYIQKMRKNIAAAGPKSVQWLNTSEDIVIKSIKAEDMGIDVDFRPRHKSRYDITPS